MRPLLARWLRCAGPLGESGTVLVVGTVIASSLATDLIGLHYFIGAFASGAIMPPELRSAIRERFETVVLVALLPFFFILTGLKTNIPAASPAFVGIFLLVCGAAIVGKLVGTVLPARWLGESWSDALTLGVLMQSKGLMEVIVLTILYDAGVLRPDSFTALLLMALVTTAIAKPLLQVIEAVRRRRPGRLDHPAEYKVTLG